MCVSKVCPFLKGNIGMGRGRERRRGKDGGGMEGMAGQGRAGDKGHRISHAGLVTTWLWNPLLCRTFSKYMQSNGKDVLHGHKFDFQMVMQICIRTEG